MVLDDSIISWLNECPTVLDPTSGRAVPIDVFAAMDFMDGINPDASSMIRGVISSNVDVVEVNKDVLVLRIEFLHIIVGNNVIPWTGMAFYDVRIIQPDNGNPYLQTVNGVAR